jgi:hypothetical protein
MVRGVLCLALVCVLVGKKYGMEVIDAALGVMNQYTQGLKKFKGTCEFPVGIRPPEHFAVLQGPKNLSLHQEAVVRI